MEYGGVTWPWLVEPAHLRPDSVASSSYLWSECECGDDQEEELGANVVSIQHSYFSPCFIIIIAPSSPGGAQLGWVLLHLDAAGKISNHMLCSQHNSQ